MLVLYGQSYESLPARCWLPTVTGGPEELARGAVYHHSEPLREQYTAAVPQNNLGGAVNKGVNTMTPVFWALLVATAALAAFSDR